MEWIKCSERMPENDTNVLVYGIGGINIMAYESEINWWYEDEGRHDADEITHWMPLPEIPNKNIL